MSHISIRLCNALADTKRIFSILRIDFLNFSQKQINLSCIKCSCHFSSRNINYVKFFYIHFFNMELNLKLTDKVVKRIGNMVSYIEVCVHGGKTYEME